MCGAGYFELGTLGDGVSKCVASCPSPGYITNLTLKKCIKGCKAIQYLDKFK